VVHPSAGWLHRRHGGQLERTPHWARKLIALSLDARIASTQLVEPYRMEGTSGKNDVNVRLQLARLPHVLQVRFIPVKSQQGRP
jgi:transposase